ncbi:MAG: D-alanyl-D-alanine carboxypeptidase family protein [Lachnospiraceae bacterium]|nr:D-alanyl-D-alanine carboxypeptidase family protein [Lachnospiraceae bacterium]
MLKKLWTLVLAAAMLVIVSAAAVCAEESLAEASQSTQEDAGEEDEQLLGAPLTWPVPGDTVCDYYCVMDADTGAILAEKGMDTETPPASLTKIMTCLIALENGNLEDTVTMTQTGVAYAVDGSSNLYTQVGEEFKLEDMLYGMMLKSANDISTQIGEHVGGGSLDTFLEMMNRRAEELGCTGSYFANACGMPNDEHHSTAHDLALISREALKNDMFREIVHTNIHTIPATNMNEEHSFQNHHKFLVSEEDHYDGIIGGKTGYTDLAQSCLATYVERDGRTVIVIALHTMGMENCYNDTRMLCDFGLDQFENVEIPAEEEGKLIEGGYVTLPQGVGIGACTVERTEKESKSGWKRTTLTYKVDGREVGTAVYKTAPPPTPTPTPSPVPDAAESQAVSVSSEAHEISAESDTASAPSTTAASGNMGSAVGAVFADITKNGVTLVGVIGGVMLVIIIILIAVNVHLSRARKRLNKRLKEDKHREKEQDKDKGEA